MLIQPEVLKSEVLKVRTSVFICGPGYNSAGIEIRERVRKTLESVPGVSTVYGEEIETKRAFKKQSTDLQTLEAFFAHDVDFTLLLLESPGAIAELGAFAQMRNIRGRLIVLVPKSFYRAESYIARGPLSLIAKHNPNNIIYYDPKNPDEVHAQVKHPLTFYKFAHHKLGFDYLKNTMWRYQKVFGPLPPYDEFIAPILNEYFEAITLASILAGDRPNYSELLLLSGIAPTQLNDGLHPLLNAKKVVKFGSGRYRAEVGWDDPTLKPFNTSALSKVKARMLAAT